MASILLKPFYDLRDLLNEKYGISEITPYMCASANTSSLHMVSATKLSKYADTTIEVLENDYNKLRKVLNESYVVTFNWDGKPRKEVLMKDSKHHMMFPHYTRFCSSNNITMLDLEYNDKTNEFVAYTGYPNHRDLADTKQRMSNVVITKITI